MDNLFLSREVGSIEIGPQIFTKSNILNENIYFRNPAPLPDPPGLLNSVLVSNAGLNNLNFVYTYIFLFENKPYYNHGNENVFIIWLNNTWGIYDFLISSEPIYFSSENVLYPWNVQNWSVLNPIYNPVPTVTKVL
jgi:hypothetical protein